MAKRRRTSKKKRTSRRNIGSWSASPLGRRMRRNTRHSREKIGADSTSLIARWKKHYMESRGVAAAALVNAGNEAVSRMHSLLDEGVPLKSAYEETVRLFDKDPEYVSDFADDVAHRFYLLVRDHGLSADEADVATHRGVNAPIANSRRRNSRKRRSR